ncbi:signal peptidase II, partial [Candidatus Margulisiibacteriota bacterium]
EATRCILYLTALRALGSRYAKSLNSKIGVSFIGAGIFSNLTDRVLRSGVVDFVKTDIIPVSLAVLQSEMFYNMADFSIILGAGFLLADHLRA